MADWALNYEPTLYSNKVVTEHDLVCSREPVAPMITSLGYMGSFIGAAIVRAPSKFQVNIVNNVKIFAKNSPILAGTFADRYGRKRAICISMPTLTLILVAHCFVQSVTGHIVFRFFENTISPFFWIPHISYCVETVGPKVSLLVLKSSLH